MELCGVLGLTSPISKKSFATTTKVWGKITCDLKGKSFQNAVEKAKSTKKECDIATSNTFDVATSFDGSWSSKGWTASKGILSAIAEQTCEVLDVVFKWRTYIECAKMEERKSLGQLSRLEYLDCYILHKPECLKNHEASP